MNGIVRRAAVAAGAVAVVLGTGVGVASAAGTVNLVWSGMVNFGPLAPGATSSPPRVFTLTNTGTAGSSALKITLTPVSGTPASAFTKTADTCTGTSLGPNKKCSVSVTFTAPASPGTYQATLMAASNKPPSATSVTLTGVSAKATPAVSTTPQPGSATVGSPVADQATVSGGNAPTGTVTFNLYGNANCTGTLFTDTEPLVNGVATSGSYSTMAVGTDYWAATYNGDSNNNSVSSSCSGEPVTITPVEPVITTTPQPGSATVGSSVADQATVSDGFNPTGTVTFTLYDNLGCNAPALFTDTEPLVNGVATSGSYTTMAVGSPDVWLVRYNGDSNNIAVSSGCGNEPVFVTPATPSITTTPQPGSTSVGFSVADQATVSGGFNPTGTVTFHLYASPNCTGTLFTDTEPLVNGVATSGGYTATAAGTDYWQATYNGDSNNNPARSACSGEPVIIGTCVVTDTASGQAFPVLQDAMFAATSGDTLDIQGTCIGFTDITKNLTLTGLPTGKTPATLDGNQQFRVLFINDDTVTLNGLTITGGNTILGGAGIVNLGTLTVNNSTITGNTTTFSTDGCCTSGDGGGIINQGLMTLNNTTVTSNSADRQGGGIQNYDAVTLNGTSTVSGNTAGGEGGGIFNFDAGLVTMNDTSTVTGNTAFEGGGIFNSCGTVTLNGSATLTGNTATSGTGNDLFNTSPCP